MYLHVVSHEISHSEHVNPNERPKFSNRLDQEKFFDDAAKDRFIEKMQGLESGKSVNEEPGLN